MHGKLSLTLLCSAALMFACGPRTRNESVSASDVTTRAASNDASATANVTDDDAKDARDARREDATVVKHANTPLATSLDIAVDDAVRFDFAVINQGKKKLELKFDDGRTHDVVVLDAAGREVWRWSEGRAFTQAMRNKVLRTSDSLRYEESWKDAKPGDYVAVVTLASANYPLTQRVEFTVR